MDSRISSPTIANFFLDGAKIVFGSLVVGVFSPGGINKIPWLTFGSGIILTIFFLSIASVISKKTHS
jgi:hypothetical protein